ncbi:hypothetical protein RF11_08431 [Thelohanellus kitauei]|uniref:Uncharacterized protein n=1 Tax=Thelohanellus kitauei TaxID=669202 RepID=A0A0C2IHW5_THEKT|nr:hypothetical protein RF11_08431 [Thelohanellus kitauei]
MTSASDLPNADNLTINHKEQTDEPPKCLSVTTNTSIDPQYSYGERILPKTTDDNEVISALLTGLGNPQERQTLADVVQTSQDNTDDIRFASSFLNIFEEP